MDRHGPIHLGEGQAVALIGDDLGGVRWRNDDPVCNRIRQSRPFVADVAREEKHEDLESKQVADPDLSLECIRGKLFNDRDAEFRRYYRMLSGLPADHEVERQEEPAGLAMYRGSVIPANIRTRIEGQK